MTKTTSYKNSLRLKELGFKADFDYCYTIGDPEGVWNKTFELDCWGEYDEEKHCASYDWDTIVDALPAWISDEFGEMCDLEMSKEYIGYYRYGYDDRIEIIEFDKQENESLADTASRLLVKLIEGKIINLKED